MSASIRLSDDEAVQSVRDVVLSIVRSLVDAPDEVQVSFDAADDRTSIEVTAADSDVQRLLGSNGRTARSLRTIAHSIGTKSGRYFSLQITSNR